MILVNKRAKGDIYEARSVEILKREKYEILQCNYRNRNGEIDIIAKKDEIIIFIEVKYRATLKFGYGSEAVDRKKITRIYKTAMQYLVENSLEDSQCRFDCMSYLGNDFKWDKNIVWGDEIGF